MILSSRLLRRAALVISTALASSFVVGLVAQAHHAGHANQIEVPLPITLPDSFFVQVMDQSIYTPTLTDGKVNVGYDLRGQTSQVKVQSGSEATNPDGSNPCPANRPTPLLRIALVTASGNLTVGGHVTGKTVDITSGAPEDFAHEFGDVGGGTAPSQERQLLLLCK